MKKEITKDPGFKFYLDIACNNIKKKKRINEEFIRSLKRVDLLAKNKYYNTKYEGGQL